jgi:integral membrane protein
MLSTNLSRLRLLGYLEGISFLILLGVCMPLKYIYHYPKPTMFVGMAHGLLFMSYCAFVYIVRSEQKWNAAKTFWAVLAAFLPFGTFVADARLFKR